MTLDASVSVSAIKEACTLESDGVCTETKFAEVGRFGGGALGGSGGAAVGTGICVAVGIGTGGPGGIACLVLLGGAGSAAGGAFGSSIFKSAGEELYQYIYSE